MTGSRKTRKGPQHRRRDASRCSSPIKPEPPERKAEHEPVSDNRHPNRTNLLIRSALYGGG